MRLSFYRTGASSQNSRRAPRNPNSYSRYTYWLKEVWMRHKATPSKDAEVVEIDGMQSSHTVKKIANLATADYTLIYLKPTVLKLGYFALDGTYC